MIEKTIAILALVVASTFVGRAAGDDNGYLVDLYEFQVLEVRKNVEIGFTSNDLTAAPTWNGVRFDQLPLSMEKAVEAARKFLKQLGCDPKHYYLQSCALKRVDRLRDAKQWYWAVTFTDDWLHPASVSPVFTIPVLLSGRVPKASVTPVKQESDIKEGGDSQQ